MELPDVTAGAELVLVVELVVALVVALCELVVERLVVREPDLFV
ncbi:MAG: hypothetical protein ABSH04_03900 [Acidimicrobiales bacterium]